MAVKEGGKPGGNILKIYVSAPGDVGQECMIAANVLERIKGEFSRYFDIRYWVWEHDPLNTDGNEDCIIPSESDIAVCILWSRLGSRLPAKAASFHSSGTEFEMEDASEAYRNNRIPDLLVYRKTSNFLLGAISDAGIDERVRQKRELDYFLDKWFGNAAEGFKAAFQTFASPDAFEDLFEKHIRALVKERIPAVDSGGPAEKRWLRDPFRGLEAFDYSHSGIFFGRTKAVGELKDVLVSQARAGRNLTIVYGMSGCGKSSLVRAGLLPTITRPGVVEGMAFWRWCVFRPGGVNGDVFGALANALAGDTALPALKEEERELKDALENEPAKAVKMICGRLEEAAAAVGAGSGSGSARLLVVVDQLEELFSIEYILPETRSKFSEAVNQLCAAGPVWIVCTMRSDCYHRLAEIPSMARLSEGGEYRLLKPETAEIGQMIRYPASAAGLSFEIDPETGERLDDLLHKAACQNTASLPLMEFTLQELYKRRQTKDNREILTFHAYQELGGLEGALARRAEDVLGSLPDVVQATFPRVFRTLITVRQDMDNIPVSRPVSDKDLSADADGNMLLDAFVKARLLITDRDDRGDTVIKVAHEAILTSWPRLKKLIDDDKEFLRTRSKIANYEALWVEKSMAADFLLPSGKLVRDAEAMLNERGDELDSQLCLFIAASGRKYRKSRNIRYALAASAFVIISAFSIVTMYQVRQTGAMTVMAQEKKKIADNEKQNADNKAREELVKKAEAQLQTRNAELSTTDALEKASYEEQKRNEFIEARKIAEARAAEAEIQKKAANEKERLATEQEKKLSRQWADAAGEWNGYLDKKNSADKNRSIFLASLSSKLTEQRGRLPGALVALAALPNGLPDYQDNASYTSQAEASLYKTLYFDSFSMYSALIGHKGSVIATAFSSDGSAIATSDDTGLVRVWDVKTCVTRSMFQNEKAVEALAFSPDGGKLAAVELGDEIVVWDQLKGARITSIKCDQSSFHTAAFSSKGDIMAFNEGERVSAVDLDSGKTLCSFSVKNFQKLNFSSDDKNIVVLDFSGNVFIGNIASNKKVLELDSFDSIHGGFSADISNRGKAVLRCKEGVVVVDTATCITTRAIQADDTGASQVVRLSPDGCHAAVSLDNQTMGMWDLKSGKQLWKLGLGANITPYSVYFSSHGFIAILVSSFSNDEHYVVLDVISGDKIGDIYGNDELSLLSMDISPDGIHMALKGSDYATLLELDASPHISTEYYPGERKSFPAFPNFSPDGRYCAFMTSDTTLVVRASGSSRTIIPGGTINYVSFSPDSNKVAIATSEGKVSVWSTAAGKKIGEASHKKGVNMAVFSRDGKSIITASDDNTAMVLDSNSLKPVWTFRHEGPVVFAGFSPKGDMAVTASEDKKAIVWDVGTGKAIATMVHTGKVNYADFSPDETLLATAADNSEMVLWRVDSSMEPVEFPLEGSVGQCLFTPDGKYVIADCWDNYAHVYDAAKFKEAATLEHSSSVNHIALSADGKRLLTASVDHTAKMWDLETFGQLATFDRHKSEVYNVNFSPDGHKVITSDVKGTYIFWDVFPDTQGLVDYCLGVAARTLTRDELETLCPELIDDSAGAKSATAQNLVEAAEANWNAGKDINESDVSRAISLFKDALAGKGPELIIDDHTLLSYKKELRDKFETVGFEACSTEINRLVGIYDTINNYMWLSRAYNCMGSLCRNEGRYDEACEYFKNALDIGTKLPDSYDTDNDRIKIVINAALGAGDSRSDQKDYAGAAQEYERAFGAAIRSYQSYSGRADSVAYLNFFYNIRMGILKYRNGDYKSALACYLGTMTEAEKSLAGGKQTFTLVVDTDAVDAFSKVAGAYESLNEYGNALKYYVKAQQLADRIAGKDPGYLYLAANAYFDLGWVYRETHKESNALKEFEKALSSYIEYSKTNGSDAILYQIALKYGTAAVSRRDTGDFKGAVDYFEKSYEICKALNEKSSSGDYILQMAYAERSAGMAYSRQKNMDKAREKEYEALELLDANAQLLNGDDANLDYGYTYSDICWVELLSDNIEAAMRAAYKSLEFTPDDNYVRIMLAHCYILSGRFSDAMEIYLSLEGKRTGVGQGTYGDEILKDIKTLKEYGIAHPDFDKVVAALSGKT